MKPSLKADESDDFDLNEGANDAPYESVIDKTDELLVIKQALS